jgi:hypothetical protein
MNLRACSFVLTMAGLGLQPLTGCMAGAGYSLKDKITEAAQEYNDGVRWGQIDQAVQHIPSDRRARFVEQHNALEDELEIADCEMVHLEIDSKHEKGTARVEYVWSLKRRGLVEKTATDQVWVRKNGDWLMEKETRVKGAPLTLFDEPKAAHPQASTLLSPTSHSIP